MTTRRTACHNVAMAEQSPGLIYESVVPFENARIGAAAIYCSDGRFGEQCDDFLHNGLGLPRYDRLAVPGGAACLAGHFRTHREESAVTALLEFLIDAHGLRHVVLITHQDCAFYTELLAVSAIRLVERQCEDLAKATRCVRELRAGLRVDAFFAHRDAGLVSFESIGG